jgi:hypothetical protein
VLVNTHQIQVKASDDLRQFAMARQHAFSFTVATSDFRLWCGAAFPVFLILYDACIGEAYWLDVQQYAAGVSETKDRYVRLRVPCNNVLGIGTIRYMRLRKLEALKGMHSQAGRRN